MKNSTFIHDSAFIDEPLNIGIGTKIWHFCHISKNVTLGKDCSVGQNVYIAEGVHIGNKCKIQNNVSIYDGVTLEDEVFCGPSMVFTNVINPRSAVNRKNEYKRTLVKHGASIGANATVICGNTINEYAFIAAGAVVTKDVNAYEVVAGNPAKKIGWMSAAGSKLNFIDNFAECSITKEKYILESGLVSKFHQKI